MFVTSIWDTCLPTNCYVPPTLWMDFQSRYNCVLRGEGCDCVRCGLSGFVDTLVELMNLLSWLEVQEGSVDWSRAERVPWFTGPVISLWGVLLWQRSNSNNFRFCLSPLWVASRKQPTGRKFPGPRSASTICQVTYHMHWYLQILCKDKYSILFYCGLQGKLWPQAVFSVLKEKLFPFSTN